MAAIDEDLSVEEGLSGPFRRHEAVTPSDTEEFEFVSVSLFIGVAGDVVAVTRDGVAVTYTVPAGFILPGKFIRVNATGTTAGNIVAWS